MTMRTAVIRALALSLAVVPLAVPISGASADEMVVETDKSYSRGTYNGQNGYWVEFTRKKYLKNVHHIYDPVGPYDEAIQMAFANLKGLNHALDRATREKIYSDFGLPRDMSQGYSGSYHDLNFDTKLGEIKAAIQAGRYAVTNASSEDLALFNKLARAPNTSALVDAIGAAELDADIRKAFEFNMRDGQAQGQWWGAAGYGGGQYIYTASDGAHTLGYTHGIDWKSPDLDQAVFDRYRSSSIQNVLLHSTEDYKKLTAVGNVDAIAAAGRFIRMAELIEQKGINPAGIKIDSKVNTSNGPVHIIEGQPSPARLKELARWLISTSWTTHSPVALDLNHDGKIGVTGPSSAQRRLKANKFESSGAVWFDIMAKGNRQHIEWLNNDGDGFLVNDSGGLVSKAAAGDGVIDAHALFGDAKGYANGYHKLAFMATRLQLASTAKLDAATNWSALFQKQPVLKGKVLDSLKIWVDANHDARVQAGELSTLASLGISEVGSRPTIAKNQHGEYLIQSYFIQNGKRFMTEDVWFAEDPATEGK
jgi:hypothetical protein